MSEVNIPKTVASFLSYLKNNWILSLISTLLVGGLFVKLFVFSVASTNIELTILSSKVPFEYIDYILKPVNSNVQNRDFVQNQEELKINESIISEVSEMSVNELKIKKNENFNNGLTITLTGKNKEALEAFGVACLHYLNSNEFIKDFRRTYTENLDNLYYATNEQIERLDSIQNMIPEVLSDQANDQSAYGVLDLSTLYTDMQKLHERKEEIKREIKFNKEFKLISITQFSSKKKSKLVLLIGFVTTLIITLILQFYLSLFAAEVRKYLAE